ncbi:MAG: InlB B-repeat-containing protein [Candidatus Peribacteria bacterium]|nr:InlB B-repeat-containing protein [Candidatus Peribacteria bacterium]
MRANYGNQPSITLPSAPTRNGYTFNGWYTATS